jgi:hypothetical protein
MPNPLLCASFSSASGGVVPCDGGRGGRSAIPVRAGAFSLLREADTAAEGLYPVVAAERDFVRNRATPRDPAMDQYHNRYQPQFLSSRR